MIHGVLASIFVAFVIGLFYFIWLDRYTGPLTPSFLAYAFGLMLSGIALAAGLAWTFGV